MEQKPVQKGLRGKEGRKGWRERSEWERREERQHRPKTSQGAHMRACPYGCARAECARVEQRSGRRLHVRPCSRNSASARSTLEPFNTPMRLSVQPSHLAPESPKETSVLPMLNQETAIYQTVILNALDPKSRIRPLAAPAASASHVPIWHVERPVDGAVEVHGHCEQAHVGRPPLQCIGGARHSRQHAVLGRACALAHVHTLA
eukprot:6175312-Pleurochrysis_carterae.AAC.1